MTARSFATGRDRAPLWILVAVAALPSSVGAQERAPAAATAQESSGQAVRITAHFAFFSEFQTNLNDALIAAGLARKLREALRLQLEHETVLAVVPAAIGERKLLLGASALPSLTQ